MSAFRRKIYNYYLELPSQWRGAASRIIGLLPARYKFGPSFISKWVFIKKTEFLPRPEINRISEQGLREILLHAFGTTEFYGSSMRAAGIDEQEIGKDPVGMLKKMPMVDKSVLHENMDEFLSSEIRRVKFDRTSTGGTSGEPFYFYINSDRSAKEWAFMVDQWSRYGFSLSSKRVTFRGTKIRDKGWEEDWLTRELKFSSFQMTDQYIDEIWPPLSTFKPDFIYAYPQTAILLAKYIEHSGKPLPASVKAFLIGSENIYKGQKEYIEKVTGCKVYMWYGHSEKLVLGGYCEQEDVYHAYPQYGYTEFINQKGEDAQPDEKAEIVGTGFMNTVTPFIRYRTGDYCTYLGDHCPACGRNYHIFRDVKGRWTQEVLYGLKGNPISMSAINIHSDVFLNVFRFQFYQQELGKAVLRLMTRKEFTEKDKMAIEKEFNQKFSGSVVVEAEVVEDIPLTDRGKYKFIDQQIMK
ncbi:MAG: phenylacetate--CoA ligase family protein [Candidatus Omnitrophica bacterium]|nr:phenylacetate--CoA ligase family protein [Candidatus Omnitrophota bacterium]